MAFTTGAPQVLNEDNELTVSLPFRNIGHSVSSSIWVTGLTLASARRLSPAGLPLFIGDLPVNNSAFVSPRFDVTTLFVGNRYLFTVRGTYETNNATYGFALNQYITIPSPSLPAVTLLNAYVDVAVAAGTWTYTIYNDEPSTSTQFIQSFSLDVVAPVSVTGTPAGWGVETDNASYVLWSATDSALPYPDQIAPATSLSGFQIQSASSASESTGYILTAWDHQSDTAGLVSPDLVLSPSRLG